MEIDLYVLALVSLGVLVGVGLRYKATLFSDVGGLVGLAGLAYLVSSQSLELKTNCTATLCTPENASTLDYTFAIAVLAIAVAVSFYITLEIRIEGRIIP